MDEALLEAFQATTYMVCLDEVEWASIRVDQPLPPPLRTVVGVREWGFITAWNPRAQLRAVTDNVAALREMLTVFRGWPGTLIRPGIGIGANGWIEPSLFVAGPDQAMLDALARQHGQLAYVHGQADGVARLRLLPP